MRLPESKIESAASQLESRYMLRAVKFDAEGKRMLATDGHILAIVPVETNDNDCTGVLSLETIAAARLAQKQSKSIPINLHVNGKATIEAPGEIKIEHPLMEGKFPKCDEVVPKFEGPCTIAFNVDLLLRLADALKQKETGKHIKPRIVQLWIKDRESTVLVKIRGSEGIGVIMPCRV